MATPFVVVVLIPRALDLLAPEFSVDVHAGGQVRFGTMRLWLESV